MVLDWVLGSWFRYPPLVYRKFEVVVVEYVEDDLVQYRKDMSQFRFAHSVVIVEVVAAGKVYAMIVKRMMVIALIIMVPWE